MAKRLDRLQSDHDIAVKLIAEIEFDLTGRKIYTNPGQQHNFDVGGVWPDIALVRSRPIFSDQLILVAEIETPDSVTNDEASQWKTYSELGCNFVLYVPFAQCEEARRLCNQHRIMPSELKWYSVVQGTLVTQCC